MSNAGTARKYEVQEIKTENKPKILDFRSSATNMHSYATSKDLNEVNSMVKSVERRISYIPPRSPTANGPSIYLN